MNLLRVTTFLTLISMTTASVSAADRTSASCLPAETFAALRIPAGKNFADHLIKQTKFGKVLFNEDRWKKAQSILADNADFDLDEAGEKLAKFGLSMDDFKSVLGGESGIAFLSELREGRQPVIVGLAWIEPGEEQAGRMFNAIAQSVDESEEDQEFPLVRHDIELGGYKVMHLIGPEVDDGEEELDFEAEWEMDDADEDEDEAEVEEEDSKSRMVDQTHLLLVHRKSKLLLAFTVPQSRKQVIALLDAEKKIDWDQMTGAGEVKGVFARFLVAHDQDSETVGPFAQRAMDAKGLNEAMPAGIVGMEAMIDLGAVIDVSSMFDDTGEAAPAMKSLGLNQLGFMSMRWSLDGNLIRAGTFIQAPAPRKAMLAALDQEALKPEPLAWVPYDVMGYVHLSFDLGKFYTLIKQMVIEIGGQDAANGLQMAEQQSMMMLQADVATILSSLGHQHTILTYPPSVANEDVDANDMVFTSSTQRTAFVWQLADEQLWQRVMQMIGGFAQMSNGAMVFMEEQGFSGWRLNQPPIQGGLFLGKGYLVMTIGEGVTETTLAALSNPPEGDAALRNSDIYKRASQFMNFKPGVTFNVSDMQRAARSMKQGFQTGLTTGVARAGMVDSDVLTITDGIVKVFGRDFVTALLQLLPNDKELEGMFGVAAGDTLVDDNGVTGRFILELPPPDAQ